MENMRDIKLQIPETLAAKLNLVLQIEGRNMDDLAIELFEAYTKQFVEKMAKKKADNTLNQEEGEDQKLEIAHEMIEVAYEIAKRVFSGTLTRTEGKRRIHEQCGMREGSAQDYITDFLAMMKGAVYRRTLSSVATEYFLRSIQKDYGIEKFKLAADSTRKHLEYYQGVSGSTSPKRRKILEKLEKEFNG